MKKIYVAVVAVLVGVGVMLYYKDQRKPLYLDIPEEIDQSQVIEEPTSQAPAPELPAKPVVEEVTAPLVEPVKPVAPVETVETIETVKPAEAVKPVAAVEAEVTPVPALQEKPQPVVTVVEKPQPVVEAVVESEATIIQESRINTSTVIEPDDVQLAESAALIWEAEWANSLSGSFAFLSSRGASGDVAMWAREGSGRNIGKPRSDGLNAVVDLGRAEWEIDVPKTGRYKLYMRVWASDKCGNSCWVGMDANGKSDLHYFPGDRKGPFGSRRYNWPERMFKKWLWIDDYGISYALTKGRHTLRIDVREDGFAIDQIALVPMGAKIKPSGVMQTTIMPQQPDKSADIEFSMALTRYAMPRDRKLHGLCVVRLNGSEARDVNIELEAESLKVGPQPSFTTRLTPQQPVARIPFEVVATTASARQGYRVRARVNGRTVSEQRLAIPLDWRVIGPAEKKQLSQIGMKVLQKGFSNLEEPPLPDYPDLRWNYLHPSKDYNVFGAIDLNEVYGEQTYVGALLLTRIKVEKSGVYRVVAAGDDTLRLMVDGKRVIRAVSNAPLTDSIEPYMITLEEGEHTICARVDQNWGKWQFFVDFQNRDGSPTKDIEGLVW